MTIARLLLAVLLCCVVEPALALRCGNNLVSEGDPKIEVLKHCGEPVSVERRRVVRAGIPRRDTSADPDELRFDRRELLLNTRSYVEVNIEEWTYNFGPQKLMRVVIFENGLVAEIRQLGHGFRD